MTDVVLAVEDPAAWHAENLSRNREHYSGLAWFGPSAIAAVQRRGAGLYFNPYARVSSGRLLKYGVVSRGVLEDDLSHWNSLYVAGRMHKPVRVLCDHADTAALAAVNHRSALTAALLMLPAEFTEDELYLEVSSAPLHFRTSAPPRLRPAPLQPSSPAALQPCSPAALQPCSPGGGSSAAAGLCVQVAGLSYSGDVRQGLAENPRKVRRRFSRPRPRPKPRPRLRPSVRPRPKPRPDPSSHPQVNDIVGAQLPLLREIYAAPLAESRIEAGGRASTTATSSPSSAAEAEAEAGQAARARQQGDAASVSSSSAAGEAVAGEAAAAARMYLPISLEARQELVRPLPPLPSQCTMPEALRPTPQASHRTGQPRPETLHAARAPPQRGCNPVRPSCNPACPGCKPTPPAGASAAHDCEARAARPAALRAERGQACPAARTPRGAPCTLHHAPRALHPNALHCELREAPSAPARTRPRPRPCALLRRRPPGRTGKARASHPRSPTRRTGCGGARRTSRRPQRRWGWRRAARSGGSCCVRARPRVSRGSSLRAAHARCSTWAKR